VTDDERRELAQQFIDLPRLYLSSDADPITDRGDSHRICAHARLQLVNPGNRPTSHQLVVAIDPEETGVETATLTIAGHETQISGGDETVIPLTLYPGTTEGELALYTPDVTCGSTIDSQLPSVSAELRVTPPSP
jgi:hypothetical protein